jgi:hypothetical protein
LQQNIKGNYEISSAQEMFLQQKKKGSAEAHEQRTNFINESRSTRRLPLTA